MTVASLTQRIEGSPRNRIWREFATNSAIFPVLDGIRAITTDGVLDYVTESPHYLIFLAATIQAWFLGRRAHYVWWERAIGNLIAPSLYTLLDIILEGSTEFWSEANHWAYWIFALGMTFLYLVEVLAPRFKSSLIMLKNLWRVMLFPALYALSELSSELPSLAWHDLYIYWFNNSGHLFIFLAALLFGILLALNEIHLMRYMIVLRQIAQQLKQVSEWSFEPSLLAESLNNQAVLQQQRVRRAILFMDIRGFTRWSETKEPETVVEMLNQFYELAEEIVVAGGGNKPHFIGDEVMSWFDDPQQALTTARQLSQSANVLLQPYGLSAGAGLHLGEVVEGLMGSSATRSYNIIGDAVNTASRLVSAAGPGELLVSEAVLQAITAASKLGEPRAIRAKGKQQPVLAYAI